MNASLIVIHFTIKGPEDPSIAKVQAPNSLRAKYGEDSIKNYVHCSESTEAAQRVLIFGENRI